MATPHRLLAAVYTHGPRFSGFEQQVWPFSPRTIRLFRIQTTEVASANVANQLNVGFYGADHAQDAQDFLYFLLERASEELKEASRTLDFQMTVQPNCRITACLLTPADSDCLFCGAIHQEGLGDAHLTRFDSLFKGTLQSTLRCPNCPHTS